MHPLELSQVSPLLLHLPTPEELPWIPRPAESHHTFAAGFLVIAGLMSAEALSGSVWHRSYFRRMLFPAMLVFMGWGMVVVAFIEPQARLVHVVMGLPLVIGGWAEHRYRMGEIHRKLADALIVPALLLAAFDTLAFHLDGPPGVVYSHMALGLMVVAIAVARVYQSGRPDSLHRALLISVTIVAMSGTLLVDSFLQAPV
jgi:hypothetical protein